MSRCDSFDEAYRAAVLAMVASYQALRLRRTHAVWRVICMLDHGPSKRTIYRWLRDAGLTNDYRGVAQEDRAIRRRTGSPMRRD